MGGSDDRPSTGREDAGLEAVVLRQLLHLHPTQVTIGELVTDLASHPADFAERDAIERAVRELTRAGLVNRNGGFVLPSRAALRFAELLE